MKLSATTMEVSLCLLLLISVQTIAEPSTDKTGKIQPPPVPSSPTQNPPPSPPTNNENTMFMPETISQMRSLRYLPLNQRHKLERSNMLLRFINVMCTSLMFLYECNKELYHRYMKIIFSYDCYFEQIIFIKRTYFQTCICKKMMYLFNLRF